MSRSRRPGQEKSPGLSRIGIYSGTFDPVHAGHMAFALQAMQVAELDRLYFLPERRPRRKHGVEHFGHRVAMLKQAVRPYPKFAVLETDDVSFSVRRTLPRLEAMFPDAQLVFLFGSDAAEHMAEWPHIDRLFLSSELVIGMRSGQTVAGTKAAIASWPNPPLVTLLHSHAPDVSSSAVRRGLQTRQPARGLLRSVAQYSNHHWLYVSFSEK